MSGIVTVVWFLTSPNGYFWPVWVMFGMGIGAVFAGWDAYSKKPVMSDAAIDTEMKKLRGN
ncbi:MAG: 2TM domain-containing protein [Pontimonas sp.]|nr:2TM domain-containing protein [Pontimonas sp.]